ncbi:UdgX family uracil-DNA binding protein [Phenylobacterium soli]|uniref:Type-4 uracil-DNA glycosylase n=1 Tax=Phenylobacterium soli TaxID=2170551 RepID=A0A328AJP8_9CAUL|nr:UdgX family uracil-DNA binding protein [Phenylobacterium soli]RAK54645.1 uracil-DNA glycosylase [Phenylobacterium soli]
MPVAALSSETDFDGWRAAARSLRSRHASPEEVMWTVGEGAGLFEADVPAAGAQGFSVPRAFVDLAREVILHRAPERLGLLYRLLWRLEAQPRLLEISTDADVAQALAFQRQVRTAIHKMHAFVRFREVEAADGEAFVAWFEPAHRVTEAAAPFFVKRFANMRWSILTPDACAHWDRSTLAFTAGVEASAAPAADALEDYWRTYYASIFNPARIKVAAMKKEMPVRYWRNLPEAALIPELIAGAEERTRNMVRQQPSEPSRRAQRAARRLSRDAPYDGQAPTTLEEVAAGIEACRRCELWRDATQGVPGEGPGKARLMLVGEQPGDQEDLAGQPFVGPAGGVLDKALAAAGVPRAETFVTNAVKHFKHELRGKRRLHKTPGAGEVSACRWWLDAERRIVRPRVIVALGATAALSVFGKATPIGKFRQQAIQLPDQVQGVVTYHPSYLLRVPDAEAKAKAYAMFVEDLKFAWHLAA